MQRCTDVLRFDVRAIWWHRTQLTNFFLSAHQLVIVSKIDGNDVGTFLGGRSGTRRKLEDTTRVVWNSRRAVSYSSKLVSFRENGLVACRTWSDMNGVDAADGSILFKSKHLCSLKRYLSSFVSIGTTRDLMDRYAVEHEAAV